MFLIWMCSIPKKQMGCVCIIVYVIKSLKPEIYIFKSVNKYYVILPTTLYIHYDPAWPISLARIQ